MNQQNMSKTPSSGPELPVKRKRGRPRKDESMSRNEKRQIQTSSHPPTISAVTAIQQPPIVTMNHVGDNHNIVGQVVTGVIDGFFDAGYLISVRVGPNNTLLRGLVFQQGHFCQITPPNDVAPSLNMCRRENFQIPISNQNHLFTPQASCAKQQPQLAMPVIMQNYQSNPMMGGSNISSRPPENVRMVGQDELLQVFEVSKMVEEPPKNDDCGHEFTNEHLLSASDPMTESFHKNDDVKHQSLPCGAPIVQDTDTKSAIDDANKQKLPSFEINESKKQEGEVTNIDVNQVPHQGVATDLFQTE